MNHNSPIGRKIFIGLEASVYVAPTAPGLTRAEIMELCRSFGLRDGEVSDHIMSLRLHPIGEGRLMIDSAIRAAWAVFAIMGRTPFVDLALFDRIIEILQEQGRELGAANARIDHSVLVERVSQQGFDRDEIEGAIAVLAVCDKITDIGGVVSSINSFHNQPIATQQMSNQIYQVSAETLALRNDIFRHVKDIVSRRHDGRLSSPEPLRAFPDLLDDLGYGNFRMWWVQTCAELERATTGMYSLSVMVLSAALVEGALTLVVKHARDIGLGPFGSSDFADRPDKWKLSDLIKSASFGGVTAILDDATRRRADELNKTRGRIHAGRLMAEYTGPIPDFRPEDAKEAVATAVLVVRRIIDWVQAHKTP